MNQSLLYKEVVEPAHWVGLMKSDDLLDYLRVSSGDVQPLDLGQYISCLLFKKKNAKKTHLFQQHSMVSFKY